MATIRALHVGSTDTQQRVRQPNRLGHDEIKNTVSARSAGFPRIHQNQSMQDGEAEMIILQ